MSDSEIEEVFNIKLDRKNHSAEAREDLAETLTETIEQTYEITINIPSKYYEGFEMLQIYKLVWNVLLDTYKSNKHQYFIETCKSGQLHLHGYLIVAHPSQNFYHIDESLRLEAIWNTIMKSLDKRLYRINKNRFVYKRFYRMVVSPAVCINAKEIISTNWLEYIQKQQPINQP